MLPRIYATICKISCNITHAEKKERMLTHSLFFLGAERGICCALKVVLRGSMHAFMPALKNLPLAIFLRLVQILITIDFRQNFLRGNNFAREYRPKLLSQFRVWSVKRKLRAKERCIFLQKKIEQKPDNFSFWRREEESNLRNLLQFARFPSVCLKPLDHLCKMAITP